MLDRSWRADNSLNSAVFESFQDALKFLRESVQNLDNDLQFSGSGAEAAPMKNQFLLVKVNTLDATSLMR